MKGLLKLAILLLLGFVWRSTACAQSFADVPGIILPGSYEPSPASTIFGGYVWTYGSPKIYTTSPSIVVLPDGDYVLTSNIFGDDSGADVSGTTKVWHTSDQGLTWTQRNTLTEMKRGSLFTLNGDLYIWGYTAAPGMIHVRRSTDKGISWTYPSNELSGLISTNLDGGSPHNPVFYSNRVWMAQTGSRSFSVATNADLLNANSWIATGRATVDQGPLGSSLIVSEAQIVASPNMGVVVLPKIGGLPNSALLRVGPDPSTMANPANEDWVYLPGGEKKFGASYDPVSGRFYVLSNPVLAAHTNEREPAELVRNTGALISSTDLVQWNVEALFLYSANVNYEGFQYFNFDFDGDDMIVASRTAFDVGGNRPPRGHDSNLITFHRIENFRTIQRDHRLRLVSGVVRRYEKTQHADAPLGVFALGNRFDDIALTSANGFAVADDGDVYIRETGGRMLHFDPAGNFLATVASSPNPIQTAEQPVSQPPVEEAVWVAPGSGPWNELLNWYYWKRAITPKEIAVFGSAARSPAAITIPSASRAWWFEEQGHLEGWELNNVTNAVVSGGVLRAKRTGADTDLALRRPNLNWDGNRASEVRLRMRAEVPSATIDFQWGTSTHASRSASRRILVEYTGNGAFQELVIPMTGVDQWADKTIIRLFLSPRTGDAFFEIDSVWVVMETDGVRIGGLTFRNDVAYTLTGLDPIRLAPESGPAYLRAERGAHVLDAPVLAEEDAVVMVEAGSELVFNKSFVGAADLSIIGSGQVAVVVSDEIAPRIDIVGDLMIGADTSIRPVFAENLSLSLGDSFLLARYGGTRTGVFRSPAGDELVEKNHLLFAVSYATPGEVRLNAVGETFAGWADRYALPSGQDTPEATPAGDGVQNAIKYLLGFAPMTAILHEDLPGGILQEIDGQRYLLFNVAKDPTARRGEAYVEFSEDLETWARNDELVTVFEETSDQFKAGLPLSEEDKGFIRLMVRMLEP